MKKAVLLILSLCSYLNASNPIGDVYFAKKFLNQYPVDNEEEFYRGLLFPGIKELNDNIDLHQDHVVLSEIVQESSPFTAGILFHSYLHNARAHFIAQYGPDLPNVPRPNEFLQLVENEILYHTAYFGSTARHFHQISQEELNWANEELIQQWHTLLINSLADSPRYHIARLRFAPDPTPYTAEELNSWHRAFPLALQDPKLLEYVDQYRAFMEKKLLEK
jgi:hypothetical protein